MTGVLEGAFRSIVTSVLEGAVRIIVTDVLKGALRIIYFCIVDSRCRLSTNSVQCKDGIQRLCCHLVERRQHHD